MRLAVLAAAVISFCIFDGYKIIIDEYKIVFVINFSFVGVIYLMTDERLEYMLKTGIDRLVFMFLPVMILLLIEYINFFKRRLII